MHESIIVTAENPHTAVPNWLTYAHISDSAYRLAVALLTERVPPTRETLAELLRCDVRSIGRWITELEAAHILSIHKAGRRNMYRIHHPESRTQRSGIVRSGMPRSRIVASSKDNSVTYQKTDSDAVKPRKQDIDVLNRSSGGGDHDHVIETELPPTTKTTRTKVRPNITTDTGKWMIARHFNPIVAAELQHLDLAACKADYATRRAAGQGNGAIIEAWRAVPPTATATATGAAPATDGPLNPAAIRAQYGDLFAPAEPDDMAAYLDRSDADIAAFLEESGL